MSVLAVRRLEHRGELFDDADGVRTGTAQTLSEVTFTPSVHVAPGCTVRAEVRYDHSNEMPFLNEEHPSRQQLTAAFNAVYAM